MKQLFIHTLLIFAFCALAVPAEADTEFQLLQLTTADGLANNTIRHIMQDTNGNLWICTSNGLSRYDGKTFVNFRPSRERGVVSLNDQRTKQAFEVDGRLWINTANDFSCYDLKKGQFIDYKEKKLPLPAFPRINSREITDKQGRTWRVTDNDGLYIINNKTGETEHFTTTSKNNPLPTNALKCIFQDKNGTIWIGTDNLGISQIDVVQNDGVKYLLEGENIRLLMHLGKDKIAVGNRSGDVFIYDPTLSTHITTIHREKNTYCVLEDHEGNIWEGTKGGGLYKNGTVVKDTLCREIYSILEDKHSRLWIGTFGEGLIHDGKTYFTDDYSTKRIRKLIADKKGKVWVATSNGVFVFSPSDLIKNPKAYQHYSVENEALFSNEIRTIFADSKGNIYIAETGEGFAVLKNTSGKEDRKEGRNADKPEEETGKATLTHYTVADSLVNNMVQSFVEDKDGFVWISTEFGISKFSPRTKSFKSYFFSKNMLNNVYSENCGILLRDGRIAFGTNNGLIIITPSVYNQGEKTTEISADDITVNGQPSKRGIIYVASKWWKSPWAILAYIIIIIGGAALWMRIRRNTDRFHKTIKELNIKKDKLAAEKEEIKEHYSTEVKMRREAKKNAFEQEFINKIEEIANRELSNPEFSADDFAAQMGMGRTVFFNKIKAVTGYSPKEYIKMKRIKRAADLISTSTQTIGEIAICVGIDDPLYFSRVFKQQYGMSPTEWRNQSTKA